jgi:hypothetical protein
MAAENGTNPISNACFLLGSTKCLPLLLHSASRFAHMGTQQVHEPREFFNTRPSFIDEAHVGFGVPRETVTYSMLMKFYGTWVPYNVQALEVSKSA